VERVVLRRLAIFVGHFTLDAALAVVTDAAVDQAVVVVAIDSLVAKSMVATQPIGAMMRYRLLDTTRAYALELSAGDAGFADLASRHAAYYRRWLEQTGAEWSTLSTGTERAPYFAGLNNVRAALEWCFSLNGNAEAGVGLAAAAVPVFWAMSLLPECHRWSERALQALGEADRGGPEEMHLQAGLGTSLMNMHGEGDAARAALNRSLAIAEERGDMLGQMGLLGMLHMFHLRGGHFTTALHYARRSSVVAGSIEAPAATVFADCMVGRVLFLMGELGEARAALESTLQYWSRPQRASMIYLAADRHYRAGVALARTLWLLGHPAQAIERAHQAIDDVKGHPVSLTGALAWVIGVFFWAGDLRSAETYIGRFISDADSNSLGPHVAVGQGLKGQLAICRGDAVGGVDSLQRCLDTLHEARYGLLTTEFNISLAQGLAATGRSAEGLTLIDRTIQLVENNGDFVYMPELLRVQGYLLLSGPQPREDEAEICLMRSLEFSRRYQARAWELRAATDLAALRTAQGQSDSARALLQPVLEQFAEGFDTTDLIKAQRLLATSG
jgi:predicted ATPase